MKRVVLKGPGRIVVEPDEVPEPSPGEALVEVAACGFCGSDLHSFTGEHPLVIYPVTPGHEFSGTITAVGEGADPRLTGSRVCVEPSLVCGECPQCRSGRYNICENLRVMGFQAPGAMCGFLSVPVDRLHLLPEGMTLLDGALAEPVAVGVHALARSGAGPGDTVLIVGAGVIGLMVMKAAGAIGCRTVVVENDPARVRRAIEFGADEAHAFAEYDPSSAVSADGGCFGAAFECVGRPETIDLAVRSAPRGGTVVAVGVFPGSVPVPMAYVQDGEIDIKGTLMYTGEDFEKALLLIASGAVRAADFITHSLALQEVERGFEIMKDPGSGSLKVLLDIRGGD